MQLEQSYNNGHLPFTYWAALLTFMVEQKRTLHHAYQQGNPVQTTVMCCRVLVLLYGSECWRMTEKDNPRLADGNHLTAKAMEMATGHYGIE